MYQKIAFFINKKFNIDAHYFLKGGFWLSVGQAATIGFGLLSTALLAHFLSAQDYGMYRYLIGIAVILSTFSLTGLGQAILQTAAKKHEGFYLATLKTNFFYSLASSAAAFIGAAYYWFNENSLLAIGCLMIAALQPLITTFQNTQPLLQGLREFQKSTIWHTTRMFIVTLISVAALLITQNVLVLFFIYLGGTLVVNLLSHYTFKPKNAAVPNDILTQYLQYAKHTSVRNLISNVAQRADTIIVFTQLGATELAIYSIATVIPEQVKGSFKNLANLLLPKYANHTDPVLLQKSIEKRSWQLFIILLFITIIYIALAPLIFQLIFPKYQEAIIYSQFAAIAFPTFVLLLPLNALQARLAEQELYKITIFSSIFQILILCSLVFTLGLLGAIIAKLLYRVFFLILVYFHYKKLHNYV